MQTTTKAYVDRDQFMSNMLKCLDTEDYKKATEHMTDGEKHAAWTGMAFCAMYASTHTPYIAIHDERKTYPCNWCGSCPIWLAAFELDTGLDTLEKVIVECTKRGCNLVGKKVENDA